LLTGTAAMAEEGQIDASDLWHFGSDAANELSSLVLEYTHLVINSEWNSLANGELDSETMNTFEKLQIGIHMLEAKAYVQKSLRSNLIQDIDEISDHRQHRAFQAVPDPPHFIYVALVGFLITMAALSGYRLTRVTVRMISLYCGFIGLVIYFMLAMSSPFYGVMKLSPQPLERIVIQIQNLNTAVIRQAPASSTTLHAFDFAGSSNDEKCFRG
jgi:hypothetical protein